MKRRLFIQAGWGWAAAALARPSQAAVPLHWQTTHFTGLGTTLSVQAAHRDADALQAALAQARQVVADVEDQLSLFRPHSALCELNRKGVLLNPPEHLWKVLALSQRIAAQSGGAFDVTVQPLWSLYAQAQQQGRLPAARDIQGTLARVGWQQVTVSPARITLRHPAMGITLNGIAQGYASDLVRAQLQRAGIAQALINTGEWSALGHAESGRDWRLGLADPHQPGQLLTRLPMQGLAVATSADDQCTFSADRRHHHILNPRTGTSPSDVSSVTVVAASGAVADALTKVLFVGGYERALARARAWNVVAVVVHKDGRWRASSALRLERLMG